MISALLCTTPSVFLRRTPSGGDAYCPVLTARMYRWDVIRESLLPCRWRKPPYGRRRRPGAVRAHAAPSWTRCSRSEHAAGRSALLLFTCNRCELYWSGPHDYESWFRELARRAGRDAHRRADAARRGGGGASSVHRHRRARLADSRRDRDPRTGAARIRCGARGRHDDARHGRHLLGRARHRTPDPARDAARPASSRRSAPPRSSWRPAHGRRDRRPAGGGARRRARRRRACCARCISRAPPAWRW